MSLEELTEKQRLFVDNYINNGCNAYRAAIDAGYAETSARVNSCRMLDLPHIRAVIDKRLPQVEAKIGLTRERKLKALERGMRLGLEESEDYKMLGIGLSCLTEANRMQGDHAAEKHVTVNLNTDADISTVRELLSNYKRDY